MVNINSLERDELRQVELFPRHTMIKNTNNTLIPNRSKPGIRMTAPTVRHRDVGDKYAKVKEYKSWNMECENAEAAGNLCNGQVSLEHSGAVQDALEKTLVRCQQMTDTRFISVETRTDMSMRLDFLCIRT